MEFPKGGIIGKGAELVRQVQRMKISSHAANAGYFIVLSVFPALVLILSLLRYTELDAGDLLHLLEGFLPAASLSRSDSAFSSIFPNFALALHAARS